MVKYSFDDKIDYYVDNLILSSGMLETHERINNVLNATIAIAVWFFTKNLICYGIAFVIYDILSIFIENAYISFFTKKKEERTLDEMEKIYQKALKDKEKYEEYFRKNCQHCGHYMGYCDVPPGKCKRFQTCYEMKKYCLVLSKIEYYGPVIETRKKEQAAQQEALEKQETLAKNVTSKNYEDKMQYFADLLVKVKFYEENGITILTPIHKSIDELVEQLEKKPDGLSFVPNRIYLYLDEIVSIMKKYMELEEERKKVYDEQISQIADILSKDIQSMIERIQNSDEADIDISIAVLMSELKNADKDGEDKNV